MNVMRKKISSSHRITNLQQIKITDREDSCNLSSIIITTFELSIVQIVGLGWLFQRTKSGEYNPGRDCDKVQSPGCFTTLDGQ